MKSDKQIYSLYIKFQVVKSNYTIKYAVHPKDFKGYDTSRIRNEFLMEDMFQENKVVCRSEAEIEKLGVSKHSNTCELQFYLGNGRIG